MLKKLFSVALVALLVGFAPVASAYAGSKEEKQARFTEKVRAGIAKLGTGQQARIQVKLADKSRLNGYVSEATQDDFVVVDRNTGAATRVTYAQVKQVRGNNLSTGAKVAIGLAILAAILAIFLFLENYG